MMSKKAVQENVVETEGKRIFDLEERLVNFAVLIIRLVENLPSTLAGKHIASQLIRSGTSPAPNYGEAQSAESRADFIHKLKISLKELRETKVWLHIIIKAQLIKQPVLIETLIEENNQLISIFVSSIRTARSREKK
jgi:four helix bundle protein